VPLILLICPLLYHQQYSCAECGCLQYRM
jgi:hypothetical protein